eukprot:2304349-Prymnesium_polylepis.1
MAPLGMTVPSGQRMSDVTLRTGFNAPVERRCDSRIAASRRGMCELITSSLRAPDPERARAARCSAWMRSRISGRAARS